MARSPKQQELKAAKLSPREMEAAIVKIDRRLADIKGFDISSIVDRSDPRIAALSSALDGLLIAIFGPDTIQYDRFRWKVTELDTASTIMFYDTPLEEVREGIERGLANASSQLEVIKSGFQEALEDAIGSFTHAGRERNDLSGSVHPEILKKCEPLLQAGAYSEAAEKSFKIVRDRLRLLTGHETASEAFGKGHLYIPGAAAPNVDRDFNEGAKFLMMAIDRFRNEKSHTSEGNVNDALHAQQYLIVSSLALRFLDRAEIQPQ